VGNHQPQWASARGWSESQVNRGTARLTCLFHTQRTMPAGHKQPYIGAGCAQWPLRLHFGDAHQEVEWYRRSTVTGTLPLAIDSEVESQLAFKCMPITVIQKDRLQHTHRSLQGTRCTKEGEWRERHASRRHAHEHAHNPLFEFKQFLLYCVDCQDRVLIMCNTAKCIFQSCRSGRCRQSCDNV